MITKIANQLRTIDYKTLAVQKQPCELCGWSIQVRIQNTEMGVRCTKCGGSAVSQSLGRAFKKVLDDTTVKDIYELSSRGAFVRYLKKTKHKITLSEYFDHTPIGTLHNNIMCQDVQNLTFPDSSFDYCTSSEVFEHVEDDIKGFKEVYRVLKPGGAIIFTVPLKSDGSTIERTEITNGTRVNTLPEQYHTDSIRGRGKVFVYRNYGRDILSRLEKSGFINCEIIEPDSEILFGRARSIIVGHKCE